MDFLPNRQNRYSIRKYTIGTASILIGATLIFGVANDEAKAEETDTTAEALSASDNPDADGKATAETSVDETVASDEEVEKVAEESSESNEATESIGKAAEETATEETSEKEDDNSSASNAEVESENNVQPGNKVIDIENRASHIPTYSADNTTTEASVKPADEAEALSSITTTGVSRNKTESTPNSSTNINNENARPEAITPRSAFRSVGTGRTAFRAAETSGRNVNDKVTMSNINTTIKTSNGGTRNEFWVTSGDYLQVTGNYKVDNDVHAGDYMTFNWGRYYRPGGLHLPPIAVDLYSNDGKVVAKGSYDLATNTSTYTFTDYVDQLDDVTGSFKITGYENKKENTIDKRTYPIELNLAGETYRKDIVIDHGLKPDSYVQGNANYIDRKTNDQYMTTYLNQRHDLLDAQKLDIVVKGYKVDKSSIQVYKVTDNSQFLANGNPDTSRLEKVRIPANGITMSADGTKATINPSVIPFNRRQQYIVTYKLIRTVDDAKSRQVTNELRNVAKNNQITQYHNYYPGIFSDVSNAEGKPIIPTPPPLYKLGDYVWEDTNKDGIQDANERGIANVPVILKDAQGNELKRTTTDSNGKYLFDGLQKGNYIVEFGTPAGYVPTQVDQGSNDATDSDGLRVNVNLQGDNLTIDSGFYKEPKLKLGDYVWEDTNRDGIQDANEPGIANVPVVLRDSQGREIARTTTDNNGRYLFDNLDKGRYTVQFGTPDGYIPTTANQGGNDAIDSDGLTVTVDLQNDDLTIDSGFYKKPKLKLGDYVWEDTNRDGVQDINEQGIPNVTVVLKDAQGREIGRTTTDQTGHYIFENLDEGDYTVEFGTPDGYMPTQVDQGGNDALDSDGLRVNVHLQNNDLTIDSGFYKKPKLKLGDYVWEDTNKDGIQDANEKGIAGVTVVLKDDQGREISRTTTDNNGKYLFDNLDEGRYTVEFGTPDGYVPTKVDQGNNDATDSDGLKVEVDLRQDDLTIDSGFHKKPVKLGDYVWEDTNRDGIQDPDEKGISGVTVILKDDQGNEIGRTTTDENGGYVFEDLEPGDYTVEFETPEGYRPTTPNAGTDDEKDSDGQVVKVKLDKDDMSIDSGFYKVPKLKLGDYVWEDTNKDGIQDANEKGIADVTVVLKDDQGREIARTTTDENGKYLFDNLDEGRYTVEFGTPDGYVPTQVDQGGDDATDSDGLKVEVDLRQDDLTIDSGFHKKPVKLGDYVWEDTNRDGIQDPDEKGISGVTVILKDDQGNEIGRTTTDENGGYVFEDLEPGDYTVEFETPEGYRPTTPNAGTDDEKDSDGQVVKVKLDKDDMSIDSGFYKVPKLKLGDYVWEDTNKDGIQDANEKGIADVTVVLKNEQGEEVARTTTDENGKYLFDNLDEGKYTVEFETPE
ncbi:SdrD B-like domain-containing protein, partial [Staphylococcus americanisciuri]